MAKVTGPLFGLEARGQIGKAIIYSVWKGINYARIYAVPNIPYSIEWDNLKTLLKDAAQFWKNAHLYAPPEVVAAYKKAYNDAAKGQAKSGNNLYMHDSILKNGARQYNRSFDYPKFVGDCKYVP